MKNRIISIKPEWAYVFEHEDGADVDPPPELDAVWYLDTSGNLRFGRIEGAISDVDTITDEVDLYYRVEGGVFVQRPQFVAGDDLWKSVVGTHGADEFAREISLDSLPDHVKEVIG